MTQAQKNYPGIGYHSPFYPGSFPTAVYPGGFPSGVYPWPGPVVGYRRSAHPGAHAGAPFMPGVPDAAQVPAAAPVPAAAQVPAAAPGAVPSVASGSIITPSGTTYSPPALEESYIENILRLNLGKEATIYMTYENNREWNAKIFRGVLEAAGRDHIIISDPKTGMRYLLLMVNLDYITFDQELNYAYPVTTPVSSSLTREED